MSDDFIFSFSIVKVHVYCNEYFWSVELYWFFHYLLLSIDFQIPVGNFCFIMLIFLFWGDGREGGLILSKTKAQMKMNLFALYLNPLRVFYLPLNF